ncbi:MAG: undecaprenyldiphospho-muramoylpentapeptide beta-N-acetylglucosaminyltransferase [Bacteroidales bacterium]
MAEKPTYRILIGGGGTGGHVFPAIAIADALKALLPGSEFLFVGAQGRMEMEKVPAAGYRIEGLPVAGFQRRLTRKNLSFFPRLVASMWRSRKIIRSFRPDVAVGVGGYASGPILKAAVRRGIPIVIQEQNSYAGVTNRLLARSAAKICVAYERMDRYFPAGKLVLTGNPIREFLQNLPSDRTACRKAFDLGAEGKVCLVLGGSLGARTLNESLVAGFHRLAESGVRLIWQCGRVYEKEMQAALAESGVESIRLRAFIERMDLAYGAADVIVSRAGALSISELCMVGKPAILVPSPNVAEDHQTRNAEALVEKGAALMVADRDARTGLLDALFGLLGEEERMARMGEEILKIGIPDAADRIAREVHITMTEK